MRSYGYPPAIEDCVESSIPASVLLKVDQRILTPVAGTGMAPGGLGRKVPTSAVARQLCAAYAWGRDGPVSVEVKGYGTFLIGPRGWELR